MLRSKAVCEPYFKRHSSVARLHLFLTTTIPATAASSLRELQRRSEKKRLIKCAMACPSYILFTGMRRRRLQACGLLHRTHVTVAMRTRKCMKRKWRVSTLTPTLSHLYFVTYVSGWRYSHSNSKLSVMSQVHCLYMHQCVSSLQFAGTAKRRDT